MKILRRKPSQFEQWEIQFLKSISDDVVKYQIVKYWMLKSGYSEPILKAKVRNFELGRMQQEIAQMPNLNINSWFPSSTKTEKKR